MNKGDNEPVISIIVPVYNVEDYLQNCVDSILAQTFDKFELILVDDGSTDSSGIICDEYAKRDFRVRVIHQPNQGVSAARNAALDIIRGTYIAFIDSDDYVSEDYLLTLFTAISDTSADLSFCGFFWQREDEPDNKQMYICTDSYRVLSGFELSCLRYRNRLDVAPWGKLYRKELFLSERFPVGRVYEDQAVIPRVFYRAKKAVLIHTCHYYYRVRKNSISHSSFSLNCFDNIIHMNEFIQELREKKEWELYKLAVKHRNETLAGYIIQARKAGIKKVPKGCYMSEIRAFYILRKLLPDDKYSWHLACLHPRWVKPHAYIRKLESILTGKPL